MKTKPILTTYTGTIKVITPMTVEVRAESLADAERLIRSKQCKTLDRGPDGKN